MSERTRKNAFQRQTSGNKDNIEIEGTAFFLQTNFKKKVDSQPALMLDSWSVYALIDNNRRPLILFKDTGGLSFIPKQNIEWNLQLT